MNKKLEIIQEENSDCGISCLASIIKYYGGYIPLEVLRINTNTDYNGTNAYNIINYAKKIGFYAYGEKIDNFNNIKLPVIAHLKLENGFYHFVVIYKIEKNYLIIMDPSVGLKKIKKNDFLKDFTNVIINFNNISTLPIYKDSKFIKNEFIYYVRDNKKKIAFILLLNFIILFFTIIMNLEIKLLENNFVYMYLILIIIFINEIIQYIKNKKMIKINIFFNNRIINYFINHIFRLPSNYLKLKQKGEISSRFNELDEFSTNIFNFIIDLIFNSILIIFILLITLSINMTLFFYTLLTTIIYLFINYKIYNKIYNIVKYLINMEDDYNSNIIDYITKIFTIKHLNNYDFFIKNINNSLLNRNKIYNSLNEKVSLINSFNNIFFNLIILLLIYFLLFIKFNLSNSLLILYLINYYISLIKKLVDYYPTYILYKNIINKNNEFLSYEINNKNKLYLNNISIQIKNLRYSINNKNVLDNINYYIKNNTKLFINGPSGIGKSTLLKILNNELNNYNGTILFNEHDIKNYDISNLVSYSSQDEELFNGSIKNNLLLGKEMDDNVFNDIINICRLDKFFKTNELDTVIVNSNSISGGEKNRLILARSLIHAKKILILDEVLKEVDYDLEVGIVKNMLNYFRDKIIIYVSHKDLGYLFDEVLTFRKE